SIRVYPPDVAL
ncbi:unnamed protein product, partial [Allacma fusca]